ncbi:MAG: FAD binding domain-containing protein [Bacteroidales bacterium]|nr:FAD binding domain-containing protein [Bacteroidota bacterium]MBL6949445.1 FAD binding domain-containing protein [Bacteroidales bacterium]
MNFDIESPVTREELVQSLRKHQSANFRLGAGFTDLLIELKNSDQAELTLINLSQLEDEEFSGMSFNPTEFRVGALVTVAQISKNSAIQQNFPVLQQAALSLASGQIREVATIGGNICQASPSGDLSCALVALKATCEIMDMEGKIRHEALSGFFRGPGKTSLQKSEVLKSISIPVNQRKTLKSGFIKIGKRSAMECSIVSIGYHFQVEADGKVIQAGIAIGAVAPTVIFCSKAAAFLIKRNVNNLTEDDRLKVAELIQQAASPIDDLRASAWYRKEVLFNTARSIFE